MKRLSLLPSYLITLAFPFYFYGQHSITIKSKLDTETKIFYTSQEIVFKNESNDTLQYLLFHDWNNSFESKTTPLAIRFNEDYKRSFHFANEEERGCTTIDYITNDFDEKLEWDRYNNIADILKISLKKPLLPKESYTIKFKYKTKIPSDKFTNYGYTDSNDFNLKQWYIIPAVYRNKWEVYSNKNLDDFFAPFSDYNIELFIPNTFSVISNLKKIESVDITNKTVKLEGKNQKEVKLYIQKNTRFKLFDTNDLQIITDVSVGNLDVNDQSKSLTRITSFLKDNIGKYPFDKLVVSNLENKKNPIYGLNQLPSFLRPFSDNFQYEIEMLKNITICYLKNTLSLNPRKEKWVTDAILVYTMINYIDEYYPDTKLVGNLSKIIVLRWFYATDIDFNKQYYLGYKNMARRFIDQPLNMEKDSLLKFNYSIANTYKSGIGFKYLEDYLEDNSVKKTITDFYDLYKLKHSSSSDFEKTLKNNSRKKVDWFFDDYIKKNVKIDFTIKKATATKDSVSIVLKNKRNNSMPVSFSVLKDKKVVLKQWTEGFKGEKTITIPNNDYDKIAIDYDGNIPEVNRGNNYKNLKGVFNKPLQFRLLKDVEDPRYSQVFLMPIIEYRNIYDGLTFGAQFYNKTIIKKPLTYKLTPTYAFNSKSIIGSISIHTNRQIKGYDNLFYSINMQGKRSGYAPNLFFNSVSPSFNLLIRNKDLRNNQFNSITLRNVTINRDKSPNTPLETPNYSVLNLKHTYSNANFDHTFRFTTSYELAKKFSKLSTTITFKKLFLNNRQLNLRLYTGTFLSNNTQKDNGYFDFALDRPSDYLFDYDYLGRSESKGIFSQQYITAEGGFKSILHTRYANQWISTLNAEVSVWNWIFLYGDSGFLKNKGNNPKFMYDSGIKLSLVADYLELFFPISSTNGFEMDQPKYANKIRFKVTLSIKTLLTLFTRRWY